MTTEKPLEIKEFILKVAEDQGVEKAVALQIAEKCYAEMPMWKPYGGATSFTDIDDQKAAQEYTSKVEMETYALRGIIENITSSDEMSTDEKASAIASAASDYRTRVNGLKVEDNKSLWVKVKNILVGKVAHDSDPADEDEEDDDEDEMPKKKPMADKKVIKHEGSKWVLYSHSGKKLGTFDSEAAAKKREREINFFKHEGKEVKSSFKVFKDKDGNLRWLTFSSNAFEDLDKELFTTKALEEAVEYADKTGERGPLLIYHVPSAAIGHCDYQAVQGRFLMESGTFDDTPLGSKAAEYFANSDEERQVSIGFEYNSGDELDGVYDWLRIKERSVTPFGAAANPWTHFQLVGGKELDSKKREDLIKIVGEELAYKVISDADEATKELEGSTRYKELGENMDEKVKALYETVKRMPQDEIRKELEVQLVAMNGGKALEEEKKEEVVIPVVETTTTETIASDGMAQLATLITNLSTQVNELAGLKEVVTSVQTELKELKKTDDEKIADAMKSKVAVIRPIDDEKNIHQEVNAIVDGLKEEDVNPAKKYVDDLLKNRAEV